MRTLTFALLLLFATCAPTPPILICNYESEHKLVSQINNVTINGVSLDTVAGFNFPYILKGSDFAGPNLFNYSPLDQDLQDYYPSNTIELVVYPDGNIHFNLNSFPDGDDPMWNGNFNGTDTDIDFVKTCF